MVNHQFQQIFEKEISLAKEALRKIAKGDKLLYDAIVYNAFIDSLCSDCETSGQAIAKLEFFVSDIKDDFEIENEAIPF